MSKKLDIKQGIFSIALLWILILSIRDFHQIAWGTGTLLGGFSPTWGGLFFIFTIFCMITFAFAQRILLKEDFRNKVYKTLLNMRTPLGKFRWVLWALVLLLTVFFLQYTYWGIVFQKPYIRFMLWAAVVLLMTLLSTPEKKLLSWKAFVLSLVLTAGLFSIFASLRLANDFPFSQGWSEGNRLWDYSILFGRERYDYPLDQPISAYIDFGRQLIGGLIFLFPNAGLLAARIWVGLIQIIPYFLLGSALFRFEYKNKTLWLLLTLWVFLFLKQGPIHPPLVISAALVAMAWRSRLWWAIPLIIASAYFASASRFTWIFAAGLWIGMQELADASLQNGRLSRTHWGRAIILGLSGLFGGFLLPKLIVLLQTLLTAPPAATETTTEAVEQAALAGVTLQGIIHAVTHQPLLWYRLLPNATYGSGILLGLLFAVLPIVVVLIWLYQSKVWLLNSWQKLAILVPLIAFSGVGLVASTKIGGGGDLHNMDMFLIGLLFVAAVAWFHGAREKILDPANMPFIVQVALVLSIINSSITPLQTMRTFHYDGNIERLAILTDVENPAKLDVLPSDEIISEALIDIQTEVDAANPQGEILFMDQRQLLTFGYIQNVKLVPEYEKKLLMDKAMANDLSTFEPFYADLADKRFSLIVSEILRDPVKSTLTVFGEENNAWVKWVAQPVLCYYEPKIIFKELGVQLLVPRQDTSGCAELLPKE